MKIIKKIYQMQKISENLRKKGKKIGFVPTMGAFHEGHLALMRKAVMENDVVVVSVFVNPAQFGPKEDFKRYPRPFEKDKKLAMKEKVAIIFYPPSDKMYPAKFSTCVSVQKLSGRLCGAFRAGHFEGVAAVVLKLFNIVKPHLTYFGQKDYQQAVIIKRIIEDLNLNIELKICPTAREKDGLALSSRNKYLTPRQRKRACQLYKALKEAKNMAKSKKSPGKIISKMRKIISSGENTKIEYIKIVDSQNLEEVKKIQKGKTVIALAVHIGKARLIDNLLV